MSTILGNLKEMYQYLRGRRGEPTRARTAMNEQFRFRYALFKDLLAANSALLNILADIDVKLKGEQVFGPTRVRSLVNTALRQGFVLVKNLNVMSGGKYPGLYGALERINGELRAIVDEQPGEQAPARVMPYSSITLADADWAGGKNANLGEITNKLGIPVPKGFALTTGAFRAFFEANALQEEIAAKIHLLDDAGEGETGELRRLSAEIIDLVRAAPVPPELEAEMRAMCREVWDEAEPLLALRSSAVGEDGELSYAGQYLTKLGLRRDEVPAAWKEVIASLYSARSLTYRSAKGVLDEHLAMAAACLEMVDAQAAGVLYTRHPYDILDENILINAVWGLGPYAVDGVIIPDAYTVEKGETPRILHKKIADKPAQLKLKPGGGTEERPVPEADRNKPCLSDEQILQLAAWGERLERHYRCPQDVEWALTPAGDLVILQSRPLKIEGAKNARLAEAAPLPGHELLLDRCDIACQGVACGPAAHVESHDAPADFPEGGVLVARHSSPEYVAVMRRAAAIVVEAGSVSGHMAALAREFGVPTLISPEPALARIAAAAEITVDAFAGRVYAGRVEALLSAGRKTREAHMKGTPVYERLKSAAPHITPLNLTNPAAPEFAPEHCRTLHDLARFCHEQSYQEMFQISDLASKRHGWSFKLNAALPIDIHIIDLGGGLDAAVHDDQPTVRPDQVASAPCRALLAGMLNRAVHGMEPRPVNFRGLMSVMMEQGMAPGHVGERFGDRSYAVISEKYLNFSSRVGYHYSVVDAWCGDTVNKNYISFTFKGGAADSARKNRRVRAIALILEREGFRVSVKADRVDARLKKYPKTLIEQKMDMLGRLLIFTRQLDMLMTSEESIRFAAENFLSGNYKLDALPPEAASGPETPP